MLHTASILRTDTHHEDIAMAELLRKQFLVTEANINKLTLISRSEGISATEVVRRAIDAYQPADAADDAAPEELMELVAERLKEAIAATRASNRAVEQALQGLSQNIDQAATG